MGIFSGWPFYWGDAVKRASEYRDELKEVDKKAFRRGVITTLVIEAIAALGLGFLIYKANAATINEDDVLRRDSDKQSGVSEIAKPSGNTAGLNATTLSAVKSAQDDYALASAEKGDALVSSKAAAVDSDHKDTPEYG